MNSDLFVCHFIFCGFVEPPKKGASTSITFSHTTKRAKRGGEGGREKRGFTQKTA